MYLNLAIDKAQTIGWLASKSEETRRAYLRDLNRISNTLKKPLQEITPNDLERLQHSFKEVAPPTQRRTLAALKSFLGHLSASGVAVTLLSHQVQLPKVNTRRKQTLTRTDIQQLFACETDPRNRLLLKVLYETAPRTPEITQLRWRDVQLDAQGGVIMLRTPKTQRRREMPVSPKLWQALQDLRGNASDDEPIFRSQKGGPLTASQVFRIVQAAARRANLPSLSPHGLRHTHISHVLKAGAPLHLVQRQLGFKSVEAVARYLPDATTESTLSYLTA